MKINQDMTNPIFFTKKSSYRFILVIKNYLNRLLLVFLIFLNLRIKQVKMLILPRKNSLFEQNVFGYIEKIRLVQLSFFDRIYLLHFF